MCLIFYDYATKLVMTKICDELARGTFEILELMRVKLDHTTK